MIENLGQLFTIGISGESLTEEEKSFIAREDIGGVILFSRNIKSPEQLYDLTSEIQSLSKHQPSKCPLVVSVDMEGGRVHRLKSPFTQWPAVANLAKIGSAQTAFAFAKEMGEELFDFGFGMNYSPCLDILTNPKNELIGDRSFSNSADEVCKYSTAVIRGFLKSFILPVGKHFPGHGDTVVDSHFDLPVLNLTQDRLLETELVPFKKAFRSKLDFVMTGHLLFPNIDPEEPVTLSEVFLKSIARDQLKFRGWILSDDLDMKALTKRHSVEELPVLALLAGCDLLLYCNEPESHQVGLESVKKAVSDKRLNRQHLEQKAAAYAQYKSEFFLRVPPRPTLQEAIQRMAPRRDLAEAIRELRAPIA